MGPLMEGLRKRCLRCLNIFKVRMLALPVSGFSLVIGFLLLLLVRRDKLLFRRIFLTFIVGIPGFFLLFTWGIGILLN